MACNDLNAPIKGCLILKNGWVIDPKNKIDKVMDLDIRNGKVYRISSNIQAQDSCTVIDVSGLYVTPGIVDIHTHLFSTTGIRDAWAGDYSIMPDGFSFRSGTTTMVDAGSSGWKNFETFRHTVINRAHTRVFAFLNIASLGMISESTEQDEKDFETERLARMAELHRDVIVGVKAAHYIKPDWIQIDRALKAGEMASIPIMVDFGYFLKERPYWQLVCEKLRPGDISTHCFRGSVPIANEKGKFLDYLLQARRRGVKFDVGHGEGSFVFRNAVVAVENGFFPDTISTDLHVLSMNAFMMDMPTTMSKFLALGMPLYDIIECCTISPACIIGHPELGHLTPGVSADVAVWNLIDGTFYFGDAKGGRISSSKRFICEMTLKEGKIEWDWNARSAVDYKKLGNNYGIRGGIDHIVIPN